MSKHRFEVSWIRYYFWEMPKFLLWEIPKELLTEGDWVQRMLGGIIVCWFLFVFALIGIVLLIVIDDLTAETYKTMTVPIEAKQITVHSGSTSIVYVGKTPIISSTPSDATNDLEIIVDGERLKFSVKKEDFDALQARAEIEVTLKKRGITGSLFVSQYQRK